MDETRTQTTTRPLRRVHLPEATRHPAPVGRSLAIRNLVFRVGVIAFMLVLFLAIRHLKGVVWPHGGHAAHNAFDHVVAWSALSWVLMVPWAMADVIGWMLYRRHTPVTEETRQQTSTKRMRHPVVFRIVTRGDQPATVIATIWAVLEAMQARASFRFRVEVVSDRAIAGLPDHESVDAVVVPEEYETTNGATHKARALHYALSVSRLPDAYGDSGTWTRSRTSRKA